MKKLFFCHMMIVGIFLMSSASVWAEKLALTTGEWAPYSSETLEGYGFITEIITEVLTEMDVTPEYVFHPWARCYSLVKRGKVWAAFPYSYTEERAKEVLFSDTIGESTTKFFYFQKGKPYSYDSLEDLRPYKLAGVKGYFYEQDFQEAGLDVTYTSDELSALKRLVAGRVDLMPMNELVGWALIRRHFPYEADKFDTLEKAYTTDDLKLIVSKDFPNAQKLLRQFNETLRRVTQTDAYREIFVKYGLQPQ